MEIWFIAGLEFVIGTRNKKIYLLKHFLFKLPRPHTCNFNNISKTKILRIRKEI